MQQQQNPTHLFQTHVIKRQQCKLAKYKYLTDTIITRTAQSFIKKYQFMTKWHRTTNADLSLGKLQLTVHRQIDR